MSWVPAEQVIQAVQTQRQVLAAEQARVAQFTQYHATERAKLDAEKSQALHDLGQAVLPRLDHPSIFAAAQAVGLVGLPNENIPAKLEARRAWLVTRLQEILHDPRYANRELLRHPRTGSLMTALAQNEENRKPARGVIDGCEEHVRFARLMTIGFGTPEFSAPWWRYSYWEDRSAADEIVKKLPGKTSFAEVRDEYARAQADCAVFDAEIAGLRAQIAAGEALDQEYAALYDEHQHLDQRGLEHTRARIIQHLLTSDPGLVSQRLRATPQSSSPAPPARTPQSSSPAPPARTPQSSGLLMLFLRASGIAAKISYLDGIQEKNVSEINKDIALQQERLAGVEQRTRRRWAPMPLDKFQKLAEDRRPRYEKRWQRFGKTYNTVYVYDRYDRGRYYDDLLWWDLMTRGRYDGSYLHDVADYHRRNPSYQYDPDWKSRQAEQRAAYGSGSAQSDDAGPDDAIDNDADAAAMAVAADANDDGDTSGDSTDTTSTDAS